MEDGVDEISSLTLKIGICGSSVRICKASTKISKHPGFYFPEIRCWLIICVLFIFTTGSPFVEKENLYLINQPRVAKSSVDKVV